MMTGIPRRTGQWSSNPGMIPGGSSAIPGNSQLGIAGITNSPEGGYGGPGGLGLHQGGAGVVLEAWYPTRAVQEGS